jgi:uncharacterized protein (TIGR03083 family)
MNRDETWAAIDKHRGSLADLLETLSEEDLRHPSLCDVWTVRDVIAHLTLQQLTLGRVLSEWVHHPGVNMDRINLEFARRTAATRPVPSLIADIRAMVGSRRRNIGVSSEDALTDCLVHSQDIVLPLGLRLDLPVDAAAAAATRVWQRKNWPFYTPRRFLGFRVTATDVDWSAGSGTPVTGPIAAILLVGTGRLVALPSLDGEGAEDLRKQIAA